MPITEIKQALSIIRKVKPTKIDPKTLGYICPDGIINFQSAEMAQKYAKNRVVAALNSSKPFEKSIGINGSQVLYELDGTSKNCICKDLPGTWIHGHPDFHKKGKTTPFSGIDYNAFMSSQMKEAIIYNSLGEECKLTKLGNSFVDEKCLIKLLTACNLDYWKDFMPMATRSTKKHWKEIVHKIKAAVVFKKKSKIKQYTRECAQIENKITVEAANNRKTPQKLHEFWSKNAEKYGVTYSTTFSNFT